MLLARDSFIRDQKLQKLQKKRTSYFILSYFIYYYHYYYYYYYYYYFGSPFEGIIFPLETLRFSDNFRCFRKKPVEWNGLKRFATLHKKHDHATSLNEIDATSIMMSITANDYATHEYALVTTLRHQKMLLTHWYISNPTSLILLKGIIFTLLDSKIISFCSSTKYCWLVSLTSISKILWFGN